MDSYLDILPSEATAVAVKTEGRNFDINFDGISSTGCWVVSKDRFYDYVIVFHETEFGNDIYIGENRGNRPEGTTTRQGKEYPRYRIFIGNLTFKGKTEKNWTSFTLGKSEGYERIYLENTGLGEPKSLEPDSEEAIEGYKKDTKVMVSKRDRKLTEKRKRHDNYTCQACLKQIKVGNKYIIDCHHLEPVHLGARTTHLEDLISLCPTCHRIAHTRVPVYSLDELKQIASDIYI
ncbi:HNH endonuclease [Photobacterium chitinilyticum]|uniref:HNH endonuclease n=1 Tax=Photobacterium chitinilyticum TaxID=2485123 RepID=A0A3S3UFJ5_9GAMM|nr:HNH endonuclease [Photobacterium chitinilyticum]RWX52699.1 HNH endonuclease [Photobacterium chitinilyticum]